MHIYIYVYIYIYIYILKKNWSWAVSKESWNKSATVTYAPGRCIQRHSGHGYMLSLSCMHCSQMIWQIQLNRPSSHQMFIQWRRQSEGVKAWTAPDIFHLQCGGLNGRFLGSRWSSFFIWRPSVRLRTASFTHSCPLVRGSHITIMCITAFIFQPMWTWNNIQREF